MPCCADIIVPFPLQNVFTYRIPKNLGVTPCVGMRVLVPFGPRRIYAGVIVALHDENPTIDYELKEIIDFLDEKEFLNEKQLRLWMWISNYYCCVLGDIMKAALPSGFRLASESKFYLNENFSLDELTEEEHQILLNFADGKEHDMQSINDSSNRKIWRIVKKLVEKQALVLLESVHETFRPKTETYVRLLSTAEDVSFTPKQQKVLDLLVASGRMEFAKKEVLLDFDCTDAILKTLQKKGVLEVFSKEFSRIASELKAEEVEFILSEAQQKAYDEICQHFSEKKVTLLHGVTASGKTEIYTRLIQDAIAQGKQVLYLVPEIALTTQLMFRLKRVFGDDLGIYHSGYSDNERIEVWNKMQSDSPYKVLLGVRSALFLPFTNLGLVIVDEEHETSYKQADMSPRYHARNASIVLASYYGANVLLGSATPSFETYFNAHSGKYAMVSLTERYGKVELPEILIADLKNYQKKKLLKTCFSPLLIEKMQQAFEQREQVILFQNRRGYVPMLECQSCGEVPKCADCDVVLTVHKKRNVLECHYCGRTYRIPTKCPKCADGTYRELGLGTEKVEEEFLQIFPDKKVVRLDLDTVKKKNAYSQIISKFESGEIDALVGTQMVSKGLDFSNVSVVGVLNADSMLRMPDFRAHERTFQMLTQVSGRAGRKHKQGTVVLQTFSVKHPVFEQIQKNDYWQLFVSQMQERNAFRYPPYSRLIQITLRHRNEALLDKATQWVHAVLKSYIGEMRVFGPETPLVSRVRNIYIRRFLLKIELVLSVVEVKKRLHLMVEKLHEKDEFKYIEVSFDVDPS